MLFDGIKLIEGSEVQNLVVDSGTSFPANPDQGELFFRTDALNIGLYVYDGAGWKRQINTNDTIVNLLPDIISPGSFKSVTVDAKGRVTAGTNPTTLAGYGITDAQPLDTDLTAIASLSDTSGILRKTAADTWTLDTTSYAPLNSPALTGTPTAPTAQAGTNTTQIATTEFVTTAVANVQAGAVATADKWTTPRNLSLTGDGTATLFSVDGSTNVSAAFTLATVNSNTGSFGTASSIPTFTVNDKGLITAAGSASIAIDASQVTTGIFADARIAQSNVTQYQSALTITESQITDGSILARVGENETITGTWQFSNPVSVNTPTSGSHAVTKDYVDNIATGLDFKQSVKAATTGNITLSGTQTIDDIALSVGDRVLVKDQTTASQNGIYVVASDTWPRAEDADNSPAGEVTSGMFCFVEQGTVNADTGWVLSTNNPITLGTTALTFVQFNGLGQIAAGDGLTKSGSTINVGTASSARIVVNPDNIDLATVTDAGTGSFLKFTRDAYGRVSGTTPVVSADLTALLGTMASQNANSVAITGGTINGTTIGATTPSTGSFTTIQASSTITSAAQVIGSSTFIARGGGTGAEGGQLVLGYANGAATSITGETNGTWNVDVYSNNDFRIFSRNTSGTTNNRFTIAETDGTTTIGANKLYINQSTGLLVQHDGSNGYIRSITGSLNLGASSNNIVSISSTSMSVNGTASFSGLVQQVPATGLTAAGTTQDTALALTNMINVISTTPSGSGVILPNSIGSMVVVINAGANALNVYPVSGAAIDSLGTNAAFSLSVGAKIMFIQTSSTQYYTLNATYA
jgi:hypothetical protein